MSIICILVGGITSFHPGFCGVGGAAIGLEWPLVSLFALAVAATMGQVASAFPTAGGLYHWASFLGGRGWGWATAALLAVAWFGSERRRFPGPPGGSILGSGDQRVFDPIHPHPTPEGVSKWSTARAEVKEPPHDNPPGRPE